MNTDGAGFGELVLMDSRLRGNDENGLKARNNDYGNRPEEDRSR